MSHRKVHSHGNVPFSWEHKPGVSKLTHQKCPSDAGLDALILPPHQTPSAEAHDTKIPPPPPCQLQPPRRSTSLKALWLQDDDPFLAAIKECTKSVGDGGVKNRGRKNKTIFSCKQSCEVAEDDDKMLVRLCNLPPIPRHRYRAFSRTRD
ncbi:hypothetical protein RJ639_017196 [Escallonia herrerae]|uniref:Uncharacterized protein n=1 Tax=Escallonia herrerae TaxID=1293975 RepID=A0AA88VDM7_9ASTE|nr:hypothetical protein RJ639_017196 [Escallonia herrerae]